MPQPDNAADTAVDGQGPPQQAASRRKFVDRLADSGSFRLRVALLMAAVSLTSAYVTHVATERNAEADAVNALASQQWAEEQQVEQHIDAYITQEQRLTARYDQEMHTYLDSIADADALRPADPIRAAQLDLDAQSSRAHLAQLWPYFRAAVPVPTDGVAVYDADAARQAVRVQDWRLFRPSSEVTRDEAQQAADTASSTVLAVVILVGALFLLTLAHVAGGRRGVVLAGLGTATAVGGLAWFTALEVDTTRLLVIAGLLIVVALIVIRVPRARARLQGMDQDDILGEVGDVPVRPKTTAHPNLNEPRTTGFSRYVATAVASATLLGAAVGYLHGQASRSSEDAAWSARDVGVEAIGALRTAEERMAVDIDSYQQALSRRVDAWNAAQRGWYAEWTGDLVQADRMYLEAERLEELARRHEERSGLSDELGRSGVAAEAVLRSVRGSVWESPARLAALQDAANASARTWEDRAGMYLAALTWLAVAAYLLGLSLIFRDRGVRLLLALVGTLLIGMALVRSGSAWTGPEPTSDRQAESAADAYAAGLVAIVRGEFAEAEEHFTRAIEVRPDFSTARRDRAAAIMLQGSTPGLGVRAAFTESAVNQAFEELEAAQARGGETAGLLLDLGAMLFHRSIQTGSLADMERSVEHTRAGLALGKAYEDKYGSPHVNQLVGEANLALGLLGTGDTEGAERMYRNVGERISELPRHLRPSLVSGAVTPLERLRDAPQPPSGETIDAMKELVVSGAYDMDAGARDVRVSSTRVELFTSQLQWRATMPDFDPERDSLSVQWYRLDPDLDSWSGLPLASGPLTFEQSVNTTGVFHRDAVTGEDAYWGNTASVLSDVPPACLRAGHYRVELYVNGALQGTAEAEMPPAQTEYTPVLARDVGVAFCRPADWEGSGTPGFSTRVTSADGSRGAVIFRVLQPRAPGGYDPRLAVLDRVAYAVPEGLPDGLSLGVDVHPSTQPTVLGRGDSPWRVHSYPGGLVEMSATVIEPSGTVLVVCVYGPQDWLESEEAHSLVLSVTPYG